VALATGGGIVNRLSPSGGFTPGGSGGAWVRAGAGLHDQLPTHKSTFCCATIDVSRTTYTLAISNALARKFFGAII
jgi:hypothetical protein